MCTFKKNLMPVIKTYQFVTTLTYSKQRPAHVFLLCTYILKKQQQTKLSRTEFRQINNYSLRVRPHRALLTFHLTFGTLVEARVTRDAQRGVGAEAAAVASDRPTEQVREERPVGGGGLGRGQQRTIARVTHAVDCSGTEKNIIYCLHKLILS